MDGTSVTLSRERAAYGLAVDSMSLTRLGDDPNREFLQNECCLILPQG